MRWTAVVVAVTLLGVGNVAESRSQDPTVPVGRCARYFDDGRGYDLTQKIREQQVRFAFEMHRRIGGGGNRLSSPLGAYAVLTMLGAGARAKTLDELRHTLFGPVAFGEGFDGVAATLAALECPNEYRTTALTAANRLFLGQSVQVLPEFTDALKRGFNASQGNVDFGRAAEAAKTINDWVAEQTRNNIKEIVEPRLLTAATRLVLVNALYVLGSWAEKFDPKVTKKKPFRLENGKSVDVPTMYQRHTYPTFLYAKRPKYEVLATDFTDRLIDVLWILPAKGTKLETVLSALDATEWAVVEKQLDKRPVEFALPKFKISGGGSLTEALKAMGIREAFLSGQAHFEGIDAGKNLLYVADVLQKTTAKVDEFGFEGSAATAALMFAGAGPPKPAPPIPFLVDRPFAFVVMHRQSGAVLFVGEVRDPR